MGLNCGLTCLKYTLFLINLVGWLIGIAVFGVAIWIITDDDLTDYADAMEFDHYFTGCYILLASGLLIIILGFVGCCGAITENTKMLTGYFFALVVIFFLEIAAAIYLLVIGVSATTVDEKIQENLYKMLNNYNNEDITWVMDSLQQNLECCGVMTSHDYEDINLPTPNSCRDPVTGLQFNDNCYDAFLDYIAGKSGLLAGLAIAVAVMHIAAMVMSMCLCVGLKKEHKNVI